MLGHVRSRTTSLEAAGRTRKADILIETSGNSEEKVARKNISEINGNTLTYRINSQFKIPFSVPT